MKSNEIVTHYDVSDNLSKLVMLLDTCYELNYQQANNPDILFAIDRINRTIKQVNKCMIDTIDIIQIII